MFEGGIRFTTSCTFSLNDGVTPNPKIRSRRKSVVSSINHISEHGIRTVMEKLIPNPISVQTFVK